MLTPNDLEYGVYAASQLEIERRVEIRRLSYHVDRVLGVLLPRDCFDAVLHAVQMVNTHGVPPPAFALPHDQEEDGSDYDSSESNDSNYDSYVDDHPSVYDDDESDTDTIVLSD